MLGKLMKYEFYAVGRIMVPIYIAWVAISFLFGLSLSFNEDDLSLLSIIGMILFIAVICVAGVMTLVLIIQRFSQGLLGSEGYLMMSVPATPGQHIMNKALTSGLWSLFTGLVGVVSMVAIGIPFIVRHINEIQLAEVWNKIIEMITSMGVLRGGITVIEIMILIVIGTMAFAAEIYAAISIGHQADNHHTMFSIIAYIGFGVIETIVIRILGFVGLSGLFDWNLLDIQVNGFMGFQLSLLVILIITLIKFAVYYAITWYFTKNRLNLQ